MIFAKRIPAALISLAGILLLMALGWLAVELSFGDSVARLSYDVPFRWRSDIATPEACLVFVDEKSALALGQTQGWSRSLYTQLLQRLSRDHARAVFFDVVFSGASPTPGEDAALAAAMQEHGQVFIGAGMDISNEGGQYTEQILAPLPLFRRAAAGWGVLAFRPVDQDYSVRRIYTGTDQKAAASWVAAVKLGALLRDTPEERAATRYVDYYGPAGHIQNVSFLSALHGDDVPPGFFTGKIVFVGGRPAIGSFRLGKDEFRNPYTGWRRTSVGGQPETGRFLPGVEVHATVLLNLLRGEWLNRLPRSQELAVVLVCGLLFGALFSLLRPISALILGIVVAGGITAAAFYLIWERHLWFSWLVPVALQIPVGLGWSLGANYFLEFRRRAAMRNAFAHYLSPHMADRISDLEFDLRPGGKIVEATVMFTDLEGFTALSECLGDPQELSDILTAYFTKATKHVLENDGTIIKFIGDAVMAVWGAPLSDDKHAEHAVQAAMELKSSSSLEIGGRKLRTRVGIHTGSVLAGNLGSAQRFDYTCIGDPVNFASRLEGLNKYFGTDVLISDATRGKIPERFKVRSLGAFRVSGKKEGLQIHELLDVCSGEAPSWLSIFSEALALFKRGEFSSAATLFEQTIAERGAADGPSEFYLNQIEYYRKNPPALDWNGVVEFSSK